MTTSSHCRESAEVGELLRLAASDDRRTIELLERVEALLPANGDLQRALAGLRQREEVLGQLAVLPAVVIRRELATRQRALGGAV